MFRESAHLYDLIYGQFKDFDAETALVADLIRTHAPSAQTLLDLGSGTGRHAAALVADHAFAVHGLEIQGEFVEIARSRCPEGCFVQGDMASFDLGRTFDAVICLFSSIGYVRTMERLLSTVRCMREHVSSQGLVLVEPWFTPEAFSAGSTYMHTVDQDDLKVARISRSEVRGRISWLDFQYLVGSVDEIRHLRETHELGLFSRDEMEGAFLEGGFTSVVFDAEGLNDRGLYLVRP